MNQISDGKCSSANKKLPIVINLFAGPGSGKSTGAAYIFAKLKMAGINAELVTEFAKDKTWENNSKALACQPYVFGKQCYRMDRCADQVDVIITDSPLPMGILYNTDKNMESSLTHVIFAKFNEYNNYNYFLKRWKPYSPIGRNQTEDEARELDNKIISLLDEFNVEYEMIDGRIEGYEDIIFKIRRDLQIDG